MQDVGFANFKLFPDWVEKSNVRLTCSQAELVVAWSKIDNEN